MWVVCVFTVWCIKIETLREVDFVLVKDSIFRCNLEVSWIGWFGFLGFEQKQKKQEKEEKEGEDL